MSIHLELAAMIGEEFPSVLDGPLEQRQDALVLGLRNGVRLTIHYAGRDAYSLRWRFEGGEAGIDTCTRGWTPSLTITTRLMARCWPIRLPTPDLPRRTTCGACCGSWR